MLRPHLSMRTNAGMPPDLKMASRPSRWCDRLCRMLAVARAVSMSLVFCMALTTAATIWGDCIRARRDASFRVSWFTICAALFTTTWTRGQSQRLMVFSACVDVIFIYFPEKKPSRSARTVSLIAPEAKIIQILKRRVFRRAVKWYLTRRFTIENRI